MHFDFDDYRIWCSYQNTFVLQKEWEKYTRETTTGSAGTALGLGLDPFTFEVSAVLGVGIGAAKMANAVNKLSIIERELNSRTLKPRTRKHDFFGGYGIGLTVEAATHGAGSHLFTPTIHNTINHTANHAASSAVNHAAQQTGHYGSSISNYLPILDGKGSDKLAEKGGEALEKKCYGGKVVSAIWHDL